MKKKSVEKLINKIDIENNFDKINSQIDYDKYSYENETLPKRKVKPILQFAMVVASIYVAILAFFAIDHISCNAHNQKLTEKYNNLFNIENTEIYKLNSRKDYDEVVKKNIKFKTSLFDSIFSSKILDTNNPTNSGPMPSFPEMMEGSSAVNSDFAIPEDNLDNSTGNVTNTNVQTQGIDEADVAKCDGTYIYSLCNKNVDKYLSTLEIYDLQGNLIVNEIITQENSFTRNYNEMYVYEQSIVLLGNKLTTIYDFNGKNLEKKAEFMYGMYNDSRIYQDDLYLVVHTSLNLETEEYENLYYDGCTTSANFVYTIIKYNFKSKEFKKVSNLNASNALLYMSTNHIYLASSVNHAYYTDDGDNKVLQAGRVTVVSIFDFDLNAIGALRFHGYVLNQFSMNEYNNYFRVVSTNTAASERDRINSISIYDLSTLKKVGYLNKGIGLEEHLVKSVSYNKDTCYVVTYQNTDPLYEIDLSDVTSPTIVSIYKAPGYSNYLHNFKINGNEYLFGIGYDDFNNRKISIYHDNGTETIQIGEDFVIGLDYHVPVDIFVDHFERNSYAFNNHKALFIYNDNSNLYLGLKVSLNAYYIFKVDVNNEDVISIYKKINLNDDFMYSRCFLIDGIIYVTSVNKLHMEEF